MSKLTKAQAKAHQQAQELLAKDVLTWEDKLFVLENWREDAEHLNGVAGAFFTPWDLARDFALHVVGERVIDLCAGIGTLSLAYQQRRSYERVTLDLVCVERNPAYVAVGRKLLPEATWICGDVFDGAVIARCGRFDSAISNPPFGRVRREGSGPRYSGGEFEYHVIDIACSLAGHGAFIVPQASAGFRYSGNAQGYVRDETARYRAFSVQTGITLDAGIGVDTTCEAYGPWHGVAPRVEIVTTNDRADHHPIPEALAALAAA